MTVTAGGKVDKFHGDPVEIAGRVRAIHDGVFSASTRFNAGTFHRGPTAVVDCGGTEVILTSRPVLVFEPNHFRSLGIEPTERKILVCKPKCSAVRGLTASHANSSTSMRPDWRRRCSHACHTAGFAGRCFRWTISEQIRTKWRLAVDRWCGAVRRFSSSAASNGRKTCKHRKARRANKR